MTLGEKIILLEKKIMELTQKIKDLTKNTEEKTNKPYSKTKKQLQPGNTDLVFDGKTGTWKTYAVYKDDVIPGILQ